MVRVRADGSCASPFPRWGSKREAEAVCRGQRAWIDRQLTRFASARLDRRTSWRRRAIRRAREVSCRPDYWQLAAERGRSVPASACGISSGVGVCARRAVHICLNWRLVQMPAWVRDYVMIHELMHLKRMDHSPEFWTLVAAACPNYRDARAWLRDYRRAGL